MKVHDLTPPTGSRKRAKRVARGIGGRGGKTAGRGMKGQRPGARFGSDLRAARCRTTSGSPN